MNYKIKYNLKKLISSSFGKIINFKGNRILMYHSTGTKVKNDIYGIYSLDIDLFKTQMEYLHNNYFNDITSIKNFTSKKNSISITFDDGFADILYKATPILCKLNLPFTVFVPPKLIIEKNEYLSILELKELSKIDICTIGAHGYSHEPLTKFNLDNVIKEISSSKLWLEDTLGDEVKYMSYPHGAVNNTIKNEVKKNGFISASSSKPGVNLKKLDMLELRRTAILSHDNLDQFISKMNGEWDWTKWV
jgi:peptidoglycan/xylan/chitin deacetylase (PgdA/CDA1 family)